jgi:N-acetylmuramoyl-L-alanine amidase
VTYPRRIGAGSLAAFLMLLAQGAAWGETTGVPTRKSDGPQCDRAQFRVILDVGHTVQVPGALSARGVPEYEFNLWLANRIERDLLDAGFAKTVVLITEGPAQKSLAERVERANKSAAHLFLSIHHDSVPDAFVEKWNHNGTERNFSDRFKGHSIFFSEENSHWRASLLFGNLLGHALKTRGLQYTPHYIEEFMGHRRRQLVNAFSGVYRYDQLIVLRETRMPAVLLEAGLIINRDEELLLASPKHRARISAAVTEAVEKFCALRLPQKPEPILRPARNTEAMPAAPR